jgi:hypothetical protein
MATALRQERIAAALPLVEVDLALQELGAEEAAAQPDDWRYHPDVFADEVLGITLYDHQRAPLMALARALKQEGKRRVAVRSCNSVGKDFMAAVATLWLPRCFDDVRVVTTGPTFDQLRDIVWGREIHRLYQGARLPLPGRMLDTEWDISPTRNAVARSTNTKEALLGRHAAVVLIIVDEASAEEIKPEIWQALDTLMASGEFLLLTLGNPTRNEGAFYESFTARADDYETFHISAFDTPNLQACAEQGDHQVPRECRIIQPGLITHEWVEDMRQRYGEDSDFWRVHVLGNFPEAGANTLIPLPWIEAALTRPRRAAGSTAPIVAGLDVARHGTDRSALAVMCDADLLALEAWSERSLMATVGRVLRYIHEWDIRCLAVDDTNMHGVSDRLIEVVETEGLDLVVLPLNWASSADNTTLYHNKPSEMWGRVRDNLSPEAPQPLSLAVGDDTVRAQLQAELSRATQKYDSYGMGRIWVEKAGESNESPDLGDALALALEAWVQLYAGRARSERVIYQDSFLGRR